MTTLRVLVLLASLLGASAALGYVTPEKLAAEAGFTQRPGTQLPGALAFRDETGHATRLGDYYGNVPIVLAFAWFGCTTLCPTVVRNLAQTLGRAGVAAGGYRVLVASIDPRDAANDALRMKRLALAGDPGATRWHFLTGSDDAIAKLTRAAGFRYAYDDESHQYAHPIGLLIVTPQGRISRYVPGFDFTPADLRRALAAAAQDDVASPVDRLFLRCFHFAPTGRYGETVMWALRSASIGLLAFAVALVARKSRAPAR